MAFIHGVLCNLGCNCVWRFIFSDLLQIAANTFYSQIEIMEGKMSIEEKYAEQIQFLKDCFKDFGIETSDENIVAMAIDFPPSFQENPICGGAVITETKTIEYDIFKDKNIQRKLAECYYGSGLIRIHKQGEEYLFYV